MASPEFDDCIDTIDARFRIWSNCGLGAADAVREMTRSVKEYLARVQDPRDDTNLLIDYLLLQVHTIASDHRVLDRSLPEWAYAQLSLAALEPEVAAEFDLLMLDLDARLVTGDPSAVVDLTDLCAAGSCSRPRLMANVDRTLAVLNLAHQHRIPAAIAAATRGQGSWAQIASLGQNYRAFRLGVDLLAHLAHDQEGAVADPARKALVELCEWDHTVGHAAIRLPIHRLTKDELTRLVGIVESRLSLYEDRDPVFVPVDRRTIQETIVLKTVVFQAMDAAQLAEYL